MKRTNLFLTMTVLAALLLAACGGEQTSTSVAGTKGPSSTVQAVGTETAGTPGLTTTPNVPVTGAESRDRLTNLMGYGVWNQNGEQIGTVSDMVLDFTNSTISYVVVGAGGFLGLGEKKIPVPWKMMKVQTAGNGGTGNALVYTGDQDLYKNFPDTDLSNVLPGPGQSAENWDADIQHYWLSGGTVGSNSQATNTPEGGTSPTATLNASSATGPGNQILPGVILASQLLRSTIQIINDSTGTNNSQPQSPSTDTPAAQSTATSANSGTGTTGTAVATATTAGIDTGSSLGTLDMTVDDAIVDLASGRIQYAVVTGAFTAGQRTLAVPLKFLLWDATSQKLSLGVNTLDLVQAPAFDNGQYPDLSSDDWSSKVDSYWKNLQPAMANPTP